MALIYTGGAVSAEGPQAFSAATVVSGSYGHSSKAWLTGGTSEGIAGYFEGFVAGGAAGTTSPTGNCYGVGTWLSVSGTAIDLKTYMYTALDVGIYAASTTASTGGCQFFGINIYTHVAGVIAPSLHAMMRFNTDATGDTPDCWFHAANPQSIAFAAGAGETGGNVSGYIPIRIVGAAATVNYIRIYDSTA